jgi:hypothetical protein
MTAAIRLFNWRLMRALVAGLMPAGVAVPEVRWIN